MTATAGGDLKGNAVTTGTEAAIGAGVGVPLLLALAGMVFLYLREKRRLRMVVMKQTGVEGGGVVGMGNGYVDPPGMVKGPVYQTDVYQTPQTHELDTSRRQSELS